MFKGPLVAALCLSLFLSPKALADLTIAAASDLRPALEPLLRTWNATHPDAPARAVYGSSGRFATQIRNGAPFDVFMSADIAYPRALHAQGLSADAPRTYALGRLVLWSRAPFQGRLADLARTEGRIALAQPTHAPYGERAREALLNAGVWQQVESRLVYGENIAQAAQMAQAGAADFALLAMSLVGASNANAPGHWQRIDAELHSPLEQALIITLHGADTPQAHQLADFLLSGEAAAVLTSFGFERPPVAGNLPEEQVSP